MKHRLLYLKTQVVVCSEINTKHINTVWTESTLLNVKPVGASHNQLALKG
jgi:hypothetical protein